jgi:hypothetical protein
MTKPERHDQESSPDDAEEVPAVGPAYSTPPTDGMPDADDD